VGGSGPDAPGLGRESGIGLAPDAVPRSRIEPAGSRRRTARTDRLGAGELLLRGAQPGIVQVEELRYPGAELVHLLHRGLQLRRRFLALTFASLRAPSRRESAASSCFVPVAGGAGAGGVEETSVVLDRAAHFCGEAVVAVGLGRDDLAAVFGDRGAEGVA
jgi:hypothetical protein